MPVTVSGTIVPSTTMTSRSPTNPVIVVAYCCSVEESSSASGVFDTDLVRHIEVVQHQRALDRLSGEIDVQIAERRRMRERRTWHGQESEEANPKRESRSAKREPRHLAASRIFRT